MKSLPATLESLKSHIRCILMCAFLAAAALPLAAQAPVAPTETLAGHVLPALARATRLPHSARMDDEPITLTVMLNLSDEGGAKALEREIGDPNSQNFSRTISPAEFTSRFGPTQEAYDAVLDYLRQHGFTVAIATSNRRTITVNGTRAQAQTAFHVQIDDYKLGDRTFHAVASDPAVPRTLAPLIAGVSGLSNLARPVPAFNPFPFTPASIATAYDGVLTSPGQRNSGGLPPGLVGAGQTVALIEFDGFESSDIENWLKFAGLPKGQILSLEEVPVNGGTAPSGCTETDQGCGTTEALLDIEAVMGIAPGAIVEVFDAPQGTDLAGTVNAVADAITSGSRTAPILSLSWIECEGDISTSDAVNMDSFLSDLTAQGFTLFAASDDNGANCTDPQGVYPDRVAFPADSASAVAVGGTTPNVNPDNSYNSESWWNSSFGAGGFGISQWIVGPTYQLKPDPSAPGRSVPDVAMEANPGIVVCQATPTLSPDCGTTSTPDSFNTVGGTSLATPLWAATWAIAQQAVENAGGPEAGYPESAANGYLYSISSAFHSASSMTGPGNDFSHVGLGSPDMTKLIAKVVPPRIDSFSPASGKASGGTTVTITGVGFIGVEKVKSGSDDGTDLTIYSDTKLTIKTPKAPAERATVEVETPGGKAKSSSPFLYVPEISSVKPSTGPMEGGATITVKGLALNDDETFVFGSAKATKLNCSGSTECTMVSPANPPGKVGVQAQTTWGDGSLVTSDSQYTYDNLTIDSFTPTTGPTSGGEYLQVYGHSFQTGKGMSFSFGGNLATGVFCPDSNYCYMYSPSSKTTGPVPVTAIVGSTTGAPAADRFTFAVFPTVTGISPNKAAGGTVVTLTGTGFSTTAGQTTFDFFAINVAGTCSSPTQCTATVPVTDLGPGSLTSVTVTVDGDTSIDSVGFSYPGKPIVPKCKPGTCN
ncbi:MAG: IPT/TIG domain-containing protein [Terracidiphilus sp.]